MDLLEECGSSEESVRNSYTTGVLDIVDENSSISLKNEDSNIDIVCSTNNDVFVAMKYPSILYVEGIVELTCILGRVSVLGYTVHPASDKLTIYSLPPDSALGIHSLRVSLESDDFMISKLLQNGLSLIPATRTVNKIKDGGAVVMLSRTNVAKYDSWMTMLKKNGFDQFPVVNFNSGELTIYETVLNCRLDSGNQKGQCRFKVGNLWQELYTKVMTHISPQTRVSNEGLGLRIAVCGGKSVGKSSLIRYLVNKALNDYEAVLLLDFDIGQSECTMPGCISATIIDKPLTGPNFTHFKNPIRSFYLGHVDVAKCSNMYKESVQSLMEYCEKYHNLKQVPWFANTMGFCHGMGITLAAVVLSNFNPTYVVQIQSKSCNNNFPSLLTPLYVMNKYIGSKNLSYKVEIYESIAEGIQRNNVPFMPHSKRNIVILTYLYGGFREATTFTMLKSRVYILLTGDITLRSGDLVVFTDSSDNENVINCLGFDNKRGR